MKPHTLYDQIWREPDEQVTLLLLPLRAAL